MSSEPTPGAPGAAPGDALVITLAIGSLPGTTLASRPGLAWPVSRRLAGHHWPVDCPPGGLGLGSAADTIAEAGAGKTALLEYLAERSSGSGCRVARMVGVQSVMGLAFAGLHQLCAPMLSLLAVVAGERPLICVIDDEQWLDRASVQTLGFAARRLAADPVGLVFAAREPGAELAGLPELHVGGLRDEDARALLASALRGRLPRAVPGAARSPAPGTTAPAWPGWHRRRPTGRCCLAK